MEKALHKSGAFPVYREYSFCYFFSDLKNTREIKRNSKNTVAKIYIEMYNHAIVTED